MATQAIARQIIFSIALFFFLAVESKADTTVVADSTVAEAVTSDSSAGNTVKTAKDSVAKEKEKLGILNDKADKLRESISRIG